MKRSARWTLLGSAAVLVAAGAFAVAQVRRDPAAPGPARPWDPGVRAPDRLPPGMALQPAPRQPRPDPSAMGGPSDPRGAGMLPQRPDPYPMALGGAPTTPAQPPRPGAIPGGRYAPAPPRPPGPEQVAQFVGMLQHMKRLSFDSEMVAVVAVGGLKDDVRRKPPEVIKDLEAQLEKVKTQGIRNAIRLNLKDLYKHQGEDEKALQQLRLLIAENDKALQKAAK